MAANRMDGLLERTQRLPFVFAGLLLICRLVTVLSLPLNGLHGFGDLPWFFAVARLDGWPYLDMWAEFPPIFPFISELVYRAVGGGEAAYTYAMVLLLTLADVGNLMLFWRLAQRMYAQTETWLRLGMYLLVLIVMPYCWWYFDPLAVFCMLLGLKFIFEHKVIYAGAALGVGVLIKFFPAIALVLAWRIMPPRRAVLVSVITLGIAAAAFAALWAVSPDFTRASLVSQGSKGSWETIWALLDGNYNTGLFGALAERYEPMAAYTRQYNPAVISPLIVLVAAGAAGLAGFLRSKRGGAVAGLSLVGLAWCIFLLWSPGWSPQWVLYLLPLILLGFPARISALLAVVIILVNIAEWPVALTHGRPDVLTMTIVLRTVLFALMAVLFYRQARNGNMQRVEEDFPAG